MIRYHRGAIVIRTTCCTSRLLFDGAVGHICRYNASCWVISPIFTTATRACQSIRAILTHTPLSGIHAWVTQEIPWSAIGPLGWWAKIFFRTVSSWHRHRSARLVGKDLLQNSVVVAPPNFSTHKPHKSVNVEAEAKFWQKVSTNAKSVSCGRIRASLLRVRHGVR